MERYRERCYLVILAATRVSFRRNLAQAWRDRKFCRVRKRPARRGGSVIDEQAAGTPLPFIIWTLQRTGGTNLTRRLVQRSGLTGVEHEPFNATRLFGHITRHWMEHKDRGKLTRAIEEIVKGRVIIKHCVENVPWEITETLAGAAADAGYRHLFLYRRNEVNRLLSLHFARSTGVWGIGLVNEKQSDAAIFSEPLPVESLVKHQRHCARQLTRAWQFLLGRSARPLALAYENVFQSSDPEQPLREIQSVLAALELSGGPDSDRKFVSEIVGTGDQGTRDKYAAFPGIDALDQALQEVPPFQPDMNQFQWELVPLYRSIPWVRYAAVDSLPRDLQLGQRFDIGGVVVLCKSAPAGSALHLCGGGAAQVKWSIRSPRMEKNYPDSPNSANARFRIEGLLQGECDRYEIVLVDGQGIRAPLFDLTVMPVNRS